MAGLGAYHVDEGYSEHPMGQDEQDLAMASGSISAPAGLLALEEQLLNLSEADRAEHVCRMLDTLKTSTVAAIVDRLNPRLHLDPVPRLPPEIISHIFSYLSPDMLMIASTVSKAWRAETLETSLWRRKFVSEGWYLNISKVLKFEREHGRASIRKPLSRRAISDPVARESKRRAVSPSHTAMVTEPTSLSDVATFGSMSGTSPVGAFGHDQQSSLGATLKRTYSDSSSDSDMIDDQHPSVLRSNGRSLMIKTPNGDSRLDYNRLYSLKSQLEENWMQGRYTPFQFPNPDRPLEAHKECVYTIQFSGKHLVSGSRDKTIRIWDLETRHLVRKPLIGHEGSVLSLQFDESPEEDLIISGSSDKSIGIWQFSTGKLLRRIEGEHSEAVLCVRFDKRYLASCSKDRLIKIFNRKPLKPGDADYPMPGKQGGGVFPDYIVDMSSYSEVEDFERYLRPEQKLPLEPYSLLMTIVHHNGAVNSLHISDDRLASGSGDRTAKIFDLRTGAILTNCRAHLKGVACIEYDGTRLVSGSSDESIRIFDPATNAQVGILSGHGKLVRTIQADFADAPGARETLEEDAMLADQAFLDAHTEDVAMLSPRHEMNGQQHNFESAAGASTQATGGRHHRAATPLHGAIGAKLPPGGGGNRWSRIVSGSYDATVVVWRREDNGRWVPGQRYKVADVLGQSGPPILAETDLAAMQERARRNARAPAPLPVHQVPAVHLSHMPVQGQTPAPAVIPQVQGTGAPNGNNTNFANAAASLAAATHPGIGSMPQLHAQVHPSLGGGNVDANNVGAAVQNLAPPQPVNAQNLAQQQQQQLLQPQQPTAAAITAAAMAAALQGQEGRARAFKLQFDARRIICCSQDPRIVGWDFAAGNPEILEAAQFFTRTSHYARGG